MGPATASALLTAAEPSFPYMSDEAMDVSLKRPREYTIKRYVEYAAAIRQKAQELSSKGGCPFFLSLETFLPLCIASLGTAKVKV